MARQDAGGAVNWYGTDLLGSVRTVFDNSSSSVASLSYDAWGNVLSGTPVDRYQYSGREWDTTLGLQYSRNRMYSPTTGSFYSNDPASFLAGDPNLTRYAGNSPTDNRDPSGDFLITANGAVTTQWQSTLQAAGIGAMVYPLPGGTHYYVYIPPSDYAKLKAWIDRTYPNYTEEQRKAFYDLMINTQDTMHIEGFANLSVNGVNSITGADREAIIVARARALGDANFNPTPEQSPFWNGVAEAGNQIIESYVTTAKIVTGLAPVETATHAISEMGDIYSESRAAGQSPARAVWNALTFEAERLVGYIGIQEAVDGKDARTGEILSTTDRISRGLIGGGQLILSVIGLRQLAKPNSCSRAASPEAPET